jgi:Homeodomain-like domain
VALRFLADRLDGLTDEPRPGRPRLIGDERVEALIAKTLEESPSTGDTHWSSRSMAATTGMSQSTVSRIWRAFGLKPHAVQTWKLSTDPLFVDKVRDVVAAVESRNQPSPADAASVTYRMTPSGPASRRSEARICPTVGVARCQSCSVLPGSE